MGGSEATVQTSCGAQGRGNGQPGITWTSGDQGGRTKKDGAVVAGLRRGDWHRWLNSILPEFRILRTSEHDAILSHGLFSSKELVKDLKMKSP